MALPIRLGGLGIVDPQAVSDSEFAVCERITFFLGYADFLVIKKCHLVVILWMLKSAVVSIRHRYQCVILYPLICNASFLL